MEKFSRNSLMARSLSKGKVVWDFVLDLIFPKFCVGCGKESEWICAKCAKKVVAVATQVCPDCGRVSSSGRYCLKCCKKHRLTGIIAAAYYQEGPIKEAVHNLKYNHVLDLKGFLGKMLVRVLKDHLEAIGGDIIVTAVPMHFLKKSQRGYNQAEILAEEVVKKLKAIPGSPLTLGRPSQPRLELRSGHRHFVRGIPRAGIIQEKIEINLKIIKKIRKTKSQVSKSGKLRRENLKNSFKIINKNAIKNRSVVIVDDVSTTGTTLEECARVLRLAGAKRVWGLVVARN